MESIIRKQSLNLKSEFGAVKARIGAIVEAQNEMSAKMKRPSYLISGPNPSFAPADRDANADAAFQPHQNGANDDRDNEPEQHRGANDEHGQPYRMEPWERDSQFMWDGNFDEAIGADDVAEIINQDLE